MFEIKPRVNRNKYCYCGACVAVCSVSEKEKPAPEGALDLEETILKVNHKICTGCGICVKICPVGGINGGKTALKIFEAVFFCAGRSYIAFSLRLN